VQAAYLTLVQKSSEHQHKSTLELLHLNAFNTLPLFLTMSLVLGEPASVSASLMTEDLSFYVVFVILIRKFKNKSRNVHVRFKKTLFFTELLWENVLKFKLLGIAGEWAVVLTGF
jgi:hypothetical protein